MFVRLVATGSSRSQRRKSSSVLAHGFFHRTLLLPALEIQGLRKKQRQDTGQHCQLPAPAVKARLGELWTGFVCADGCYALRFVNYIEFRPSCLAIAAGIACCVYECDSQTHQRHNLPTDL